MSAKVVDASAVAALLFGEPTLDAVAATLKDAALHAPQLLLYELINIAWKKSRREPMQAASFELGLKQLDSLNITYHDVERTKTLQLALHHSLSGYDASYLWLARALGAELVTLDVRLDAVATARS
jgi:predicted nucleic acid-binding protein